MVNMDLKFIYKLNITIFPNLEQISEIVTEFSTDQQK